MSESSSFSSKTRRFRFVLVFTASWAFWFVPCFGDELVHLANGFDLPIKSHARNRDAFLLTTENGTLELPAVQVSNIEILPPPAISPAAIPPTTHGPVSNQTPKVDAAALIQAAAAFESSGTEFRHLVRSVAQVESGLRPNAVSAKGATGLMQLMPGTARDLGVIVTDLEQNAKGGAKYLHELLVRYGNNSVLALAAYNAGPGAVAKYRGVPPYVETRRYIEKVLREYARQSALFTRSSVAPTP